MMLGLMVKNMCGHLLTGTQALRTSGHRLGAGHESCEEMNVEVGRDAYGCMKALMSLM